MVYSVKVICELAALEAVDILNMVVRVKVDDEVAVDDRVVVLDVEVVEEGVINVDARAAPDCSVGLLPGPGVAEGSLEKKSGVVSPVS